jgi:hypothetical protein
MRRSSRRWLFLSAAVVMVIVTCLIVAHVRNRPIPFNDVAWKSAKTPEELDRRYRMIPSIEKMIESGELKTRDQFVARLGEPPSHSPQSLLYCLGTEHHRLIKIDDDWLDLRFDESGGLIEYKVRSD